MAGKLSGLTIRAKIDGLQDLIRQLNEYKQSVRTKIMRPALKKVGKVILDSAKANLKAHGFKRSDSLLLQSLGTKIGVSRRGNIYVVVGPRTGFKRTKAGKVQTALGKKFAAAKANPVRYAHLVERGRKALVPKKAKAMLVQTADGAFFARKVKAVPARPFLRPALDKNKDRITAILAEELTKGLAAAKK